MPLRDMLPLVRKSVLGAVQTLWRGRRPERIAEEVFDSVNGIRMLDCWDRAVLSDNTRIAPEDGAIDLIEDSLERIFERIRRYQQYGMKDQADACFAGMIVGLYRFRFESKTEFNDWAADIPLECAMHCMDVWKKSGKDMSLTNPMDRMVRKLCPKWERYLLPPGQGSGKAATPSTAPRKVGRRRRQAAANLFAIRDEPVLTPPPQAHVVDKAGEIPAREKARASAMPHAGLPKATDTGESKAGTPEAIEADQSKTAGRNAIDAGDNRVVPQNAGNAEGSKGALQNTAVGGDAGVGLQNAAVGPDAITALRNAIAGGNGKVALHSAIAGGDAKASPTDATVPKVAPPTVDLAPKGTVLRRRRRD